MSDSASKGRTFWDVLPSISTFFSSVVLGIVALVVNASYNERQSIRAADAQEQQRQLNKVQTLVAFMPHLSSNPETREVALFGISALGYPDLAIKLTQLHAAGDPQSGREVADAIMRDAPASAAAPVQPTPAPSAAASELGWVYLGDFSGERWTTQYLDFPATTPPKSLVDQTYAVRAATGALNVRTGMPTDQGEFPRTTRALPAGSRLRILEVHPWLTTGYIWARVAAA